MASPQNRYVQIIEQIFLKYYKEGATEVPFEREDFSNVARKLKIQLPKNLGDILYTFMFFPFKRKVEAISSASFKSNRILRSVRRNFPC